MAVTCVAPPAQHLAMTQSAPWPLGKIGIRKRPTARQLPQLGGRRDAFRPLTVVRRGALQAGRSVGIRRLCMSSRSAVVEGRAVASRQLPAPRLCSALSQTTRSPIEDLRARRSAGAAQDALAEPRCRPQRPQPRTHAAVSRSRLVNEQHAQAVPDPPAASCRDSADRLGAPLRTATTPPTPSAVYRPSAFRPSPSTRSCQPEPVNARSPRPMDHTPENGST